jgi:uncharacterized protein DUF397
MKTPRWRKSTRSSFSNCVEAAPVPAGVAVRDSRAAAGPVLRFGSAAWREFTGKLKATR